MIVVTWVYEYNIAIDYKPNSSKKKFQKKWVRGSISINLTQKVRTVIGLLFE